MSHVSDLRPMPGPDSAFISKPTKFEGIKVEAPKVSHSGKVDMTEDDENLKRLLQKTRCVNCTKMFVVDDNNDEACHYHPGGLCS
mmetsp:Transcript_1308/g.4016  ORF Transcript_1308/g.4016 Transcript_1308/m.4016 type:complete len:85 (+) Transcript_1308:404-658(+)